MRIAILANLKKNAPVWEDMPPEQWDDLDSPKTIDDLIAALEYGGHEAAFFEANIQPPFNLIENLRDYAPDLCFNIAEGHFGDGREAQIPAVLEMLRIPYTGSRVLTLALALDKLMTKRLLTYHGLPTAVFRVTGCKDVARVDFRLDEANGGQPYILEINPLPGLNPYYSDLCIQADAAGWSYERLIHAIVEAAAVRHGLIEKAGTVEM